MRGVFGAGVATAFERNNFRKKIVAIYGASAGAMNGAYLLSGQIELGSSIYWENLPNGFVSYKNFIIGVWQRFQSRFIKNVVNENLRDPLDIDYLMNIVKKEKYLDVKKIISQEIPLNVKLFNLDTHEIEYLDARRPDILEILETAVSVFPYVHHVSTIDGKKYIDAAIMEIIGIDHLKKKHPKEKIIIVINRPPRKKLLFWAKNIIEGKFMEWMFHDSRFFKLHSCAEEILAKDLEIIKLDPNIILIAPDEDVLVRSRTTDKNSILQMYNLGIKAGGDALSKLL